MECKLGTVYQRLLDSPQWSESWFVVLSAESFDSLISTESQNDQEVLRRLWSEHNGENDANSDESKGSEAKDESNEEKTSIEEALSNNFKRLEELLYSKCGIYVFHSRAFSNR